MRLNKFVIAFSLCASMLAPIAASAGDEGRMMAAENQIRKSMSDEAAAYRLMYSRSAEREREGTPRLGGRDARSSEGIQAARRCEEGCEAGRRG